MISVLLIGLTLQIGCSCQMPAANRPADAGRPQNTADRDGQTNDGATSNSAQTPAEKLDNDDDLRQPLENPLMRAIGEFVNKSPVFEDQQETDDLRTTIRQADQTLSRVKRENRDALRQMNRQVRIRGRNSPNVILLVVQGLNNDDLGCYGNADAATPNIDALAGEGIRFTRFHTDATADSKPEWCLMTGTREVRRAKSLPSLLWYAGYSTALVGDCSLGGSVSGDPASYGYDELFGTQQSSDSENQFPQYVRTGGARIRVLANADGKQGISAAELYTREALAYVERHQSGRPFFLWLAYPLAAGQSERAVGIQEVDNGVGRLVDQLDKLGIASNTIVVLSSYGNTTSEASASLPLIVNAPTRFGGHTTVDHACGAWDVLPTMLEMVGALHRPRDIDGKSFLKTLKATSAR
jgi:hypothetical protein